jgi:hypothetical protein
VDNVRHYDFLNSELPYNGGHPADVVGVRVGRYKVVESLNPRPAKIINYGILRFVVSGIYQYGFGRRLNQDSVSLSDAYKVYPYFFARQGSSAQAERKGKDGQDCRDEAAGAGSL